MSSFKEDFKAWPCGPIPLKFQRTEIRLLKEAGYDLDDMDIIDCFEKKIAVLSGCRYGVAVDCATNGLFLSLMYLRYIEELKLGEYIVIPSHTYISVPMAILSAGLRVKFEDIDWSGVYQLKPTRVFDGSVRFTKNMYVGGSNSDSLQIVSFQYKKRCPIGRGGMILTNDKDAVRWLHQARFCGRHIEIDQWHDKPEIVGWNMYMTPDDAARGILIFDQIPKINLDSGCQNNYPDLSKIKLFRI